MATPGRIRSLSVFITFLYGAVAILTPPSSSSVDTFVFGGCTPQKYLPGSPFDSNLNLLLGRLVSNAASSAYANFTVLDSGPQNTIYALYQCRGDLNSGACSQCVAGAVSRLVTDCIDACGGELQAEGCFVKYASQSFFGVDDRTLVVRNCGPPIGSDSDALTRLDSELANLEMGGGTYRVGGAGEVQCMAQCVGDLSVSECQDCICDAIGRLKSGCGVSAWGDLYLAKCYARFSQDGGNENENENGNGNRNKDRKKNKHGTEKTLNSEQITQIITIGTAILAAGSLATVSINCAVTLNKTKEISKAIKSMTINDSSVKYPIVPILYERGEAHYCLPTATTLPPSSCSQ